MFDMDRCRLIAAWLMGLAVVAGLPTLQELLHLDELSCDAGDGSAPKPSPSPFSAQLYDNNFGYKQNPEHAYIPGEELKDMPVSTLTGWPLFDATTVSTGGELRFRYIDERNRLRIGGPGRSAYDQWRWRHYVDVHQSDWVRGYIELIDGSTNHADLPLQRIDKNRWDLQNYFADLRIVAAEEHPVWFRIGRQELLYGSQRLISPLDWSNIRRNFEGVKLYSRGEHWDIDAWVVNPVNTATPMQHTLAEFDNSFDSRDQDYLFGGVYSTYRGFDRQTLDLFFLSIHQNVPLPDLPYGDRYTLGLRWLGSLPVADGDHLLQVEVEGGYQFGNDRSAFYDVDSPRASVNAGYVTLGAGHTWTAAAWQPSLWWYWDWASGDNDPTDSQNNTFFQHFGLVHAYLGLIDNIARQNISDVNYRFTVKPTKSLTLTCGQHWFRLATARDVLYNVGGAAVGTPGNGRNIGSEADITASYNVCANWSLEMGYFWFWYGQYVQNTVAFPDATQIHLMSTLRY